MYSFHPESCWVLFNFNPGADCSLYEMTLVPFSNNLLPVVGQFQSERTHGHSATPLHPGLIFPGPKNILSHRLSLLGF